jgi:hypothetical protein
MAEVETGIKSCIPASIIAGIIIAIVIVVGMPLIVPGYEAFVAMVPALGTIVGMLAWLAVPYGLIVGVIYGALYAVAYDYLPTDNSIMKGISLWIPLWILFSLIPVGILATGVPITGEMWALTGGYLALYIVWGALTGVFWRKFAK